MEQTGDIDVNDLFDEDNLNNAALDHGMLSDPALLPGVVNQHVCSPGQIEHLANLSTNGSLSSLSWARPGLIARITENGKAVEITGQRIDPKTLQWSLLESKPLDAVFDDAIGLSWTVPGTELAVIERKARVHIYNMQQNALNEFGHTVHDLYTDAKETNQPIGVWWLGLSRGDKEKKKTVLENAKENGKWKHEHIEGGFHPPHAVRALCVISRLGALSILFTRDGGNYKTAHLLLPVQSSTSIFTHAALAQTPEGRLLIALHESPGTMSTYAVSIAFANDEPLPTLHAEVICRDVPNSPPSLNLQTQSVDRYLLMHLHILPESEYSWHHLNKPHLNPKQPATLVAVYASYYDRKDVSGSGCFGNTVIKRWQFQKAQFELLSRFGSMNGTEPVEMVMQPLLDVALATAVITLQVIEPGNAIALTTIDGTTTLYDSFTFSPVLPDSTWQIVSSVGQMPLDYTPLILSPTQCISPHGLMLAHINSENKVILTSPRQRMQDITAEQMRDLNPDDPSDEAMIAGYILAFSRSCWQAATFDDVLASIHYTLPMTSLVHIRRQLFASLFQPKNLLPGPPNVSELDKVPHSQITFKALAFHFGLFRVREIQSPKEKLAYLWAWTVLNLRWSIVVIGDTYKHLHQPNPQGQPQRGQPPQPPPLPSTFLDLVCQNIRWVFNLYHFIFDSVLQTGDRVTHPDMFDAPTLSCPLGDEKGDGTQGLVALLLNCNWSRAFMLIMGRLMKAVAGKAKLNINFNSGKGSEAAIMGTGTLGRIAKTIQSCCLHHGITPEALEIFFDPKSYADTWKMGDDSANSATMDRQVEMMITGHVSEEYQDTIKSLIGNCVNGNDGLRARGLIDKFRLTSDVPERNVVFLNIDDIAFKHHSIASPAEKPKVWPVDDEFIAMDLDIQDEQSKARTNGKQWPPRHLYDVQKKLPLFSQQSLAINKQQPQHGSVAHAVVSQADLLTSQVRRCVRCGSVSDAWVHNMNKTWPRQISFLMNKCVCDGCWIVEEVKEGLVVQSEVRG